MPKHHIKLNPWWEKTSYQSQFKTYERHSANKFVNIIWSSFCHQKKNLAALRCSSLNWIRLIKLRCFGSKAARLISIESSDKIRNKKRITVRDKWVPEARWRCFGYGGNYHIIWMNESAKVVGYSEWHRFNCLLSFLSNPIRWGQLFYYSLFCMSSHRLLASFLIW